MKDYLEDELKSGEKCLCTVDVEERQTIGTIECLLGKGISAKFYSKLTEDQKLFFTNHRALPAAPAKLFYKGTDLRGEDLRGRKFSLLGIRNYTPTHVESFTRFEENFEFMYLALGEHTELESKNILSVRFSFYGLEHFLGNVSFPEGNALDDIVFWEAKINGDNYSLFSTLLSASKASTSYYLNRKVVFEVKFEEKKKIIDVMESYVKPIQELLTVIAVEETIVESVTLTLDTFVNGSQIPRPAKIKLLGKDIAGPRNDPDLKAPNISLSEVKPISYEIIELWIKNYELIKDHTEKIVKSIVHPDPTWEKELSMWVEEMEKIHRTFDPVSNSEYKPRIEALLRSLPKDCPVVAELNYSLFKDRLRAHRTSLKHHNKNYQMDEMTNKEMQGLVRLCAAISVTKIFQLIGVPSEFFRQLHATRFMLFCQLGMQDLGKGTVPSDSIGFEGREKTWDPKWVSDDTAWQLRKRVKYESYALDDTLFSPDRELPTKHPYYGRNLEERLLMMFQLTDEEIDQIRKRFHPNE